MQNLAFLCCIKLNNNNRGKYLAVHQRVRELSVHWEASLPLFYKKKGEAKSTTRWLYQVMQKPVIDPSSFSLVFSNQWTQLPAKKAATGTLGRKPEAESGTQQPTNDFHFHTYVWPSFARTLSPPCFQRLVKSARPCRPECIKQKKSPFCWTFISAVRWNKEPGLM